MMQSGSAGSSLVARIIEGPTTTTSGELEVFFPVQADGSSLQRGPDRIMGTLATGLVPLLLYLFQYFSDIEMITLIMTNTARWASAFLFAFWRKILIIAVDGSPPPRS